MNATALPVRPAPRPGEPLSSYAVRLADANGLARSRVLPAWRQDIDVPKGELSIVSALAALNPADSTRLTMDRYPLAVRGHGPQRRHGWRLHHSVAWVCPSCTVRTGHRDLLWQTALVPVCQRCSCYLIRAGGPHVAVPAHPRALEAVQVLVDLAEASVEETAARRVLYRRRRRCQQLAATIDGDSWDLGRELPPVDLGAARRWGAYPCPDPATVAALLILTGPCRLRQSKPAHLRRHQSATFTGADRDRLDWFRTRLRHSVTRHSLHPDHVPALLPPPKRATGSSRRPGQWLSMTRAAVALHMLTSQVIEAPATFDAASTALGVTGIPSSLLIEGIWTGQGLREQDAQLFDDALEVLVAEGLVDYQRRRDTLRPVRRLPTGTIRHLQTSITARTGFQELALAWIWLRCTHGPMRSSPWPQIPDREVYAFDASLDAETRLLLHDAGHQLLDGPDLTTALLTGAEVAPATTGRSTG